MQVSKLLLLASTVIGCTGSIEQPPPAVARDFHLVRAPSGMLELGGRAYANPSGWEAVDLSIHRDATTEVHCRKGGENKTDDECNGLPFRSQVTYRDTLIRCIATWDTSGARLYEGCGLDAAVAFKLGCLRTKSAEGADCAVCVGADGRMQSNSCTLARSDQPRTDCDVDHDGQHMCVKCADVMGNERHDHDPMCMDDNPNCPPENPDAGASQDGGESGGGGVDAAVDGGEGAGGGPDAGPDSGEGAGGNQPMTLACAPELPSKDIFCHEINYTYQKLGLSYGYDCTFAGTYLPPSLDALTREAIDVWLAAHGAAVNPLAPPCEAMLAMATSWDCEEEGDDHAGAEAACAKRVGRQRLAGFARAHMIRDGACRP